MFVMLLLRVHAQSAFFTSDSPRCIGDTTHFTPGAPGGTILQEFWDFGDGTQATYNPPAAFPVYATHKFTIAGMFNVSRTVKFAIGNVSYNTQVVSNPNPVANFSNTIACVGNATAFTDLSVSNGGAIISYNWNFGDGGTSTLSSPVHVFAAYGMYNVSLTVINTNGCVNTVIKPVTVAPAPVPGFTYSTPACIGSPVNFTDLSYMPAGFSSYIVQWAWDFGDGTPTLIIHFPSNPNVVHTFAGMSNAHMVSLTVTSTSNCTATVQQAVYSTPAPVAAFTSSVTACEHQPLQFIDLSQTNGGGVIISWNWDFGDPLSGVMNSSNQQNPVHYFSTPGIYSVMLAVVTSNGCSDTMMKVVAVNQAPVARFRADTVIVGSPTTFTDMSYSLASAITGRFWTFGDGQSSSVTNPVHQYAAAGLYNVTLTATDNNGCSKDTTETVWVKIDPLSGPPAIRNVTNVIVGNGDTRCYNASQVINIAGVGTLFFVLNGGSATLIAGQKISIMQGSTVQAGGYLHGYIAPVGPFCVTPSMPSVVSGAGALPAVVSGPSFQIYPNPTSSIVTLEFSGDAGGERVTVDLYGMRGEKVMTRTLDNAMKSEFSLERVPAGIYLFRVIRGAQVETARIVRQ